MSGAARQNLGLALLAGVLLGLSPHTSGPRWVPSLIGGFAGAAAVFTAAELWRRRSGRTQPGAALRFAWPRISLSLWACLAVFAVLLGPTLGFLYREWTDSIWRNGHGLFIPFIVAYLGYRTLRDDPVSGEDASPWGFAFVAAGLALVVLDTGIHTQYLAAFGLALSLPGFSLLLLGARRTRALALPLGLAFFIIPFPNALAYPLQLPLATAALTEPLIELTGIPVERLGLVLLLPRDVFAITGGCSGIAAFVAAMGLAIFLAAHTRSRLRRVLLLLAPWPLVVVLSAIRCALLLVFCHHYSVGVLEMATHGLSGIAAFWTASFGVLLFADWGELRRRFA